MSNYRCSCCDQEKDGKDLFMICWDDFDAGSPTVGVCKKCTKKITSSEHQGVLQYLQENDENFKDE